MKAKTEDLTRSPVTLKLIRDDILKYRTDYLPINDPTMQHVIKRAFATFKTDPVLPYHLNDVPKLLLDNWSTSPGLPWRNRGYRTKRDVAFDPYAFQSIRKFWHKIKNGEKLSAPDCAAYLRAHVVQKGEEKVRAVWGYPCTISFQEVCFAKPLIDAMKNIPAIAYGYETTKGGCRRIWNRFGVYRHLASFDFKCFDKTVPSWLIRIAFDILRSNLSFEQYQYEGVPVAEKLQRAWKYIENYMIRTPIRLCNGERYKKRTGIASGSYFTQLVGSICNWIIINYVMIRIGNEVKDVITFGDDSIVATTLPIRLGRVTRTLKKFGMELNVEKTQLSNNINELKFLGYKINSGNPQRASKELYASLRFPEQPDRTFDEFATRAVGLLIANLGQDLEFDNCCRNIVARQRYKVVVKQSLRRFLNILGIDQLPKHPPSLFQLWCMT